jgi:hypothetical protein
MTARVIRAASNRRRPRGAAPPLSARRLLPHAGGRLFPVRAARPIGRCQADRASWCRHEAARSPGNSGRRLTRASAQYRSVSAVVCITRNWSSPSGTSVDDPGEITPSVYL